MAIEWYLLKPPYDQLSGFEEEALEDFGDSGFEEILDSDVAIDVELCNYDLSVCKPMKAVILNRLQDTKLKTLVREALFPIGTCKAGMYVKYDGRYWLITGIVDNNKVYEKAILSICNYYLTWISDSGKIIQRWANITSASQYNNGEFGISLYTVRSDQLLILTPDDEESLLLTTGKRFIIDKRCSIYEKYFADDVVKDTSNPVITYRLTRADSVLYNYGDSGHFEFLAYQDEQRENDGYYVIDGKGYWLCYEDMKEENKNSLLSSSIEYDSTDIYNGLEPGVFIAKFYDADGNVAKVEPTWEIKCDFADKLDVDYIGSTVYISADSKDLINKSFELVLTADGYEPKSLTVTIRAFI